MIDSSIEGCYSNDNGGGVVIDSSGSGSGNAGLLPAEDLADAASCDYVLNVNTDVFHYPGCKSVKRMKEENKRYYNGTRESVIGMGYRPCGNCNP